MRVCQSQATTVATLSLRRFHRSDGLHRLNANARDAGDERFGSSEAVYRGRGSSTIFMGAICLRETESVLCFSSRRTEQTGWLDDDWPAEDREMSALGVWRTTLEASGEGSRFFYFFGCNPLKSSDSAK